MFRSQWMVFIHDLLWVPVALYLALWLRFNFDIVPGMNLHAAYLLLLCAMPAQLMFFSLFKTHRGLWRYASMPDLMRLTKAVLFGVLVSYLVAFIMFRMEGFPRSVIPLYPLLLLVGLMSSRLLYRWYKEHRLVIDPSSRQRVLLIGAGRACELLLRDIQKGGDYLPIGILDDNLKKHGQELHGTRILGGISELPNIIDGLSPSIVMFAIPSASVRLRNQVLTICNQKHIRLLALPSLNQLASDMVHVPTLRNVEIEDVLGRDPAAPDQTLLICDIRDKVVMVTGAGGSIGSELCRQVVRQRPVKLLLIESSEFALYRIERNLRQLMNENNLDVEIIPLLGSICHQNRMLKICDVFKVHTIYHAAAYKHVPLVEFNPIEAVQNNVFGTLHMAQAAQASGVEKFILISTDKAVRPTNVMGATKRCAELVLQALQENGSSKGIKTCFSMVRFGNVLGSSGSVVPLFRKQIHEGGPVTLTHKEITRYFMTIPEAAQLVIQAGAMAEGGEVFVLDMGEPIRILDLAQKMIQLSGLTVRNEGNPDGDIEIIETGLRPGEKLYEELLIGGDVKETRHPLIMQAREEAMCWNDLDKILQQMQIASLSFDLSRLRELLQSIVSGYTPEKEIHDLLWVQDKSAQKVIVSQSVN